MSRKYPEVVSLRDYDGNGVGTPVSKDSHNPMESCVDPKFNPSEALGLAEAVESYLARLVVPQGRFAGEPFPVLPWQSRFVAGAFRDGVLDAALSLGRGNGKTTLCAGLLAATVDLDGPLNSKNAESSACGVQLRASDDRLPSRPDGLLGADP